jgi:hypothetical protein
MVVQNLELILTPNDPHKKGVLQRWYKISPLLKVITEQVVI